MHFLIDTDSGIPIYRQLKHQILYAITVGELKPGDSLPSIRKLEADLKVNRNTIRRTYTELQNEGTLLIRRGKEAVVAPKPKKANSGPSIQLLTETAQKMVLDLEAKGIDSLNFISHLTKGAGEHDRRYPKIAFVECTPSQAEDNAAKIQAAWDRSVISIDLNCLREDIGLLPSSVQYVLTTYWHYADVKRLVASRNPTVLDVRVRFTKEFHQGLTRLSGLRMGLLLKDPESIPRYRDLIGKFIKIDGPLRVAILGKRDQALSLLESVEGMLFTPPCRQLVFNHAPRELVCQEFLYEPDPEYLEILRSEVFPAE